MDGVAPWAPLYWRLCSLPVRCVSSMTSGRTCHAPHVLLEMSHSVGRGCRRAHIPSCL